MRLVFAGTPAFARSALQALLDAGHDVRLVLTQPDRPSGRGLKLRPSEVKALAIERGLPLAQPPTLRDDEALRQLAARGRAGHGSGRLWPDPAAATFWICSRSAASTSTPRCCRAGAVQRRSSAPSWPAIPDTGISIMRMEAGLDTGPVYLQEAIAIAGDDTAASLHDKLAALGATCIVRALELVQTGSLRAQPQEQDGVTYAHKIEKAEAELDWTRAATELDRQVRAFNPFPVATTWLRGEPLRVWRARPLPGEAGRTRSDPRDRSRCPDRRVRKRSAAYRRAATSRWPASRGARSAGRFPCRARRAPWPGHANELRRAWHRAHRELTGKAGAANPSACSHDLAIGSLWSLCPLWLACGQQTRRNDRDSAPRDAGVARGTARAQPHSSAWSGVVAPSLR